MLALLLPQLISCNAYKRNAEGELSVHFLDVGQGDASFIELGGGPCMLVDTADAEHGERVCRYIKSLGHTRIDTLLLTHPHDDHAGGALSVLGQLEVGRILIPKADYTTPEQRSALSEAERQGVEIIEIGYGDGFKLGTADVQFLSGGSSYEDENDSSAVMKLSYGERSFLFMGDCTKVAEADLVDSGYDLSADVIKVGHHGSDGSSSERFISAVGAKYAVISCSEDNEYSHPSPYAVNRWEKSGAAVLCTDECADIVFRSDGESLELKTKNREDVSERTDDGFTAERSWILNTKTHTVHNPDCRYAKNINEDNVSYSSADITRLIAEGYRKCKNCFIYQEN